MLGPTAFDGLTRRLHSSSPSSCHLPIRPVQLRARVEAVQAGSNEQVQRDASLLDIQSGRRQLLAGLSLVATCPCCRPALAEVEEPSFTYGDTDGRQDWGGLCALGVQQSPIDLPMKQHKGSASLRPSPLGFKAPSLQAPRSCSPQLLQPRYQATTQARVKNTGIGTMQVNLPRSDGAAGELLLGGQRYQLLQFHFHTPSEHAADGQRSAMEAHLVHKNTATGGLAVLGVLLQPTGTSPHPALQAALDYAPSSPQEEAPCPGEVDPLQLLPRPDAAGQRHWLHYSGSLTTPPCSEQVEWFVFKDTVEVTQQQVERFQQYVSQQQPGGRNSRPLQPLNRRPVVYDCLSTA